MKNIKYTMAQALVKWLAAQSVRQLNGEILPAFAGVWAIFGHGNVAGLGEALSQYRGELPTFRGHNEQGMAHAAIAFAKQKARRQFMAVTSSIGPGATNMVTDAALAHVNRLPVLFLPGDVFADRRPDPVLQQIESFSDGNISANDCFKPVSRYFDRLTRPEQLLQALPKTMSVLLDPANCGPVTLSLCQDVQAETYLFPEEFFMQKTWSVRRPGLDEQELLEVCQLIENAKTPAIIAGGGVRYSGAADVLSEFSNVTGIPVASTQAGKSSMVEDHPNYIGSVGVTGTSSANSVISNADIILAVGTRLQDFTTGSNSLINGKVISLNVQEHDLIKHNAVPLFGDAKIGLNNLAKQLSGYKITQSYFDLIKKLKTIWKKQREDVTISPGNNTLPSDSQVIGAVNRNVPKQTIVIGAAGSMPGELHKLWAVGQTDGYHMEYGFSCMGYEIAAGIGVNMAEPDRPSIIFVGDGSYLMMNSEIATAVMMGKDMTIIVTDNRGFGCINRLQVATGGTPFNNLLKDTTHEILPKIDYPQHAKSLGARGHKASNISDLEKLVYESIEKKGVDVIVIDTDPEPSTEAGGTWWDVAIPGHSQSAAVLEERKLYIESRRAQKKGNPV